LKAAEVSIDDQIVDEIVNAEAHMGSEWPSKVEITPEGKNLRKLLSGDHFREFEKLD